MGEGGSLCVSETAGDYYPSFLSSYRKANRQGANQWAEALWKRTRIIPEIGAGHLKNEIKQLY